ncbi:MAG: UvrD-helicase domain-containing protein, partial [Aquaspirillum sp.]
MLNPQQRAAIRHLDGPLLVLAGAGSGKTRVITQKIAYLVQEAGISAQHIAAITFTNKAAREMLERVGKLLEPAQLRGLTVSTFHSLGLHIMRQEARLLGYKPQFSILDAADAAKILADRLASTDKAEIRRLQSQISRWKNDLISPDAALLLAQDEFSRVAAKLYLDYQDTLFAYQAVDFDDLIRLPVHLLQQHPEAFARWQATLRYLFVAEYHDTN